MDVMHLFILCVNLLTRFFVFLSVLSALHETDGGDLHFPCIFVFSIIKAAHHDFLLRFLTLWISDSHFKLSFVPHYIFMELEAP